MDMQEMISSAHYSLCCYSRRICKDQESLANAAIHNAQYTIIHLARGSVEIIWR